MANVAAGDEQEFYIDVPAGVTEISFTTIGNNGDADLYVKKGSKPTSSDYDCKSISSDSNESCTASHGEGTYYALVSAYSAFEMRLLWLITLLVTT